MAFSVLLCFFCVNSYASEWERVESGTLTWLRAVFFVDAENGWIVGSSGTYLRTVDGGRSWAKEKVTGDNIRDVVFKDRDLGWLLCEQSVFGPGIASPTYILHTRDAGRTWTKADIEPGRERMLRLVFSNNFPTAYAVGETGSLLIGDQATDQWKRTSLATQTMLTSGEILNDKEAILVGGRGTILRTENAGVTWTEIRTQEDDPRRKLNAVYFIDEKKGWAVGAEGKVILTKNGGKTWEKSTSGVDADLLDVIFLSETSGIAVGDSGTIIKTTDSGKTWTKMDSGSKHRLERIVRANDKLITVGFGGTILINGR